jgi:hypothetical protein
MIDYLSKYQNASPTSEFRLATPQFSRQGNQMSQNLPVAALSAA